MSEKRNVQIHFRLTPSEAERMRTKMKEVGICSQGAYLRKMVLDGYCINLDLRDVKELVLLLRRCAKRANETGSIYQADIQDLQERLDGIWSDVKEVLVHLASIQ